MAERLMLAILTVVGAAASLERGVGNRASPPSIAKTLATPPPHTFADDSPTSTSESEFHGGATLLEMVSHGAN